MKATAIEFRFRFLIHALIYILGFVAPWNYALHLDIISTWQLLAAWAYRYAHLTFSAATIGILVLGILFALAAAALRTWASAYIGADIVQDSSMHGTQIVAAGPYRFLRNPLYLGTFIHTFALALLMPPTGAVFTILAIGFFQLRLIAAEEAFLSNKLGEPYLAYLAAVPSLLPALKPRVAPFPTRPTWLNAILGEIYMWGVAAAFIATGGRYNALLVTQGVIVALGVSLVARAFLAKR
jgi:protein-S-isoprenylcysteine O-methyltransferase Ste14